MKLNRRVILTGLLTAVLLVVLVFPASAEAEKKPINGTCILIAFPPYFGELEPSPNFRDWSKPDGMEHWRNQVIFFTCDFNDNRLDGYFLSYDNWNVNPNEHSNFEARQFDSVGFLSDALGNDLGLWDSTGVGYTDAEGNWGVNSVFKGRGLYQGLLAKVTWSSSEFPVYQLEGELLDPGK
jgi:hypothetical protein